MPAVALMIFVGYVKFVEHCAIAAVEVVEEVIFSDCDPIQAGRVGKLPAQCSSQILFTAIRRSPFQCVAPEKIPT